MEDAMSCRAEFQRKSLHAPHHRGISPRRCQETCRPSCGRTKLISSSSASLPPSICSGEAIARLGRPCFLDLHKLPHCYRRPLALAARRTIVRAFRGYPHRWGVETTSRTRECRPWRGGRVVEGARLESVYAGNRIAGSNPAPSARLAFALVHNHSLLSLKQTLN
jgi:hypothetical protein